MRLVAVSIVKNEADIIEAFVRHSLAWVDHHLIFDHDSTDGTREILGAMQAEGLPLTLYTDSDPGHLQQARSNFLTRVAAQSFGADWVLPLDADEILTGPDRITLESSLLVSGDDQPASLILHDYHATTDDDPSIINPVLRLRYGQSHPSTNRKIFIPRSLALDPAVKAGKGSHALYRGTTALADKTLPTSFQLAHLALRSPQHQFLRVIRAELQRQSRGKAAAGLDVHYRLGYQLLAEQPELFLATICPPATGLRQQPIQYRGSPLLHTPAPDWSRVAKALLPYLSQLATSHGRLADETGFDIAPPTPTHLNIRELSCKEFTPVSPVGTAEAFIGFHAQEGWGPLEGPVPAAFLPPFHWGYAPQTLIQIESAVTQSARLLIEALTYSENQTIEIRLHDTLIHTHAFARINQKEQLIINLPLQAGENTLTFGYGKSLVTDHDSRKLAVIFLALQILHSDFT